MTAIVTADDPVALFVALGSPGAHNATTSGEQPFQIAGVSRLVATGRRIGMGARGALVLLLAPAPAEAHTGRCTGPETATPVVLATVLSIMLFRPWRKSVANATTRLTRVLLPVLLVGAVTLTGCGGNKKATSTGAAPTTTARIQIVSPTPNQTTGSDVTVTVSVIGGTVVQRVTGPLTATEGHVHISVDNQIVAMAYQTTQVVHGLKPGPHSVAAEFVTVNHTPFANPPRAAVLFTVQ